MVFMVSTRTIVIWAPRETPPDHHREARYSLGAVMVSDGPLNVTEQGLVVVCFFNVTKAEFIAGRRAPGQ
jgi:hypothetical protein